MAWLSQLDVFVSVSRGLKSVVYSREPFSEFVDVLGYVSDQEVGFCEAFLFTEDFVSELVEGLSQGFAVLDDLGRVFPSVSEHLGEHYRFTSKVVEVVVTDVAWESCLLDLLCVFWMREYKSALGSGKCFVSATGHGVDAFVDWVLELVPCD